MYRLVLLILPSESQCFIKNCWILLYKSGDNIYGIPLDGRIHDYTDKYQPVYHGQFFPILLFTKFSECW